MPQNHLQAPQTQLKLLIVNELKVGCPLSGKFASYGTGFWSIWKPFGTLWKDFSSIFPFPGLKVRSKLARGQFYSHMLFMFIRLTESRFKNLSLGLGSLWKPDCDCPGESLTAAVGTLWR